MALPDKRAVNTAGVRSVNEIDTLCSDQHQISSYHATVDVSTNTADGSFNTFTNSARTSDHGRGCASCQCKYVQRASWAQHVAYFCSLSVFAYVGMLARVYLTKLSAWNGLPLFSAFYPEVVGTAIMGIVISHKKLLENNYKMLYQGLATGLCGSITTFSSWNNNAAVILIQYDEQHPDNTMRFVGWITILILGVGMPVAVLRFGEHLGSISPWSDRRTGERVYAKPRRAFRALEIIAFVILWLLTTTVTVVIPLIIYQRYDFMFSFILASLGAYIRWHLAPWNNTLHHFKLGTFIANTLGTLILGAASVLDEHYGEEAGRVLKGLIFGVITGFCGCLTTVSTFIVELTSLSLEGSYLYGFVSLMVAQVGLLAIRGIYWWTRP